MIGSALSDSYCSGLCGRAAQVAGQRVEHASPYSRDFLRIEIVNHDARDEHTRLGRSEMREQRRTIPNLVRGSVEPNEMLGAPLQVHLDPRHVRIPGYVEEE